jgi:FMN phosphatase YigB (HAD superfamily)
MRMGIDFDDTCAETTESLLAFHNYILNNKKVTREDITSVCLPTVQKLEIDYKMRWNIVKPFFENEKVQLSVPAVPGAKEKLQQRKNQWHTLYVITGRVPEWQHTTQERIEKNLPNMFSDILFASHFTKKSKNKIDICNDLDIQVLVDDSAYNFAGIETTSIQPILLHKPRSEYETYKNERIQVVHKRNEMELA